MLKFSLFLLVLALFGCRCEVYDPSVCATCPAPQECMNGFCVCNPEQYWTLAGECYEKRPASYFSRQPGGCLGDALLLDSFRFDGSVVQYHVTYEADLRNRQNDIISGLYYYLSDRDSFRCTSPFTRRLFGNAECQAVYYGTIKDQQMDLIIRWHNIQDPMQVLDSCNYTLLTK